MNPSFRQPDTLDALLNLAAEHCHGSPKRLQALATALGMDRREASRCLRVRRSRPNGVKTLALYEFLASELKHETWLPWRQLIPEQI